MASAEAQRRPTSGSRGPQSEYIDGILRKDGKDALWEGVIGSKTNVDDGQTWLEEDEKRRAT